MFGKKKNKSSKEILADVTNEFYESTTILGRFSKKVEFNVEKNADFSPKSSTAAIIGDFLYNCYNSYKSYNKEINDDLKKCIAEMEEFKLSAARHLYANKKIDNTLTPGLFMHIAYENELKPAKYRFAWSSSAKVETYAFMGYAIDILTKRLNTKEYKPVTNLILDYANNHREEINKEIDKLKYGTQEAKDAAKAFKFNEMVVGPGVQVTHMVYFNYKNNLPVLNDKMSIIDYKGNIIQKCAAENIPSFTKYLKEANIPEEAFIKDLDGLDYTGGFDVNNYKFDEKCEAALRRYPYSEVEKRTIRHNEDGVDLIEHRSLNNELIYNTDYRNGTLDETDFSKFDFYMDYFEESILTRPANSYEELDAYKRLCEDYAGKELPIKQERFSSKIVKVEEIEPTEDDRRQFIITREDGTVMKGACRYYTKKIHERLQFNQTGVAVDDLMEPGWRTDKEKEIRKDPSPEYLAKEEKKFGGYLGYIKSFSKELRYEDGKIFYVDIDRDNRHPYSEPEKVNNLPKVEDTAILESIYYINNESVYGKNCIDKGIIYPNK